MLSLRGLPVLLIASLLFAACGNRKGESHMPHRFMDTRLQFYFDEFKADALEHGIQIDSGLIDQLRVIKFVDDVDQEKMARGQAVSGEPGTIGTCASFEEQKTINTGFKSLKTDSESWNEVWIDNELTSGDSSPIALKELVYHELGHCLLQLEHAQPKPHVIMSPEMSLNGKWLTSNWESLLTEFFNSSKN